MRPRQVIYNALADSPWGEGDVDKAQRILDALAAADYAVVPNVLVIRSEDGTILWSGKVGEQVQMLTEADEAWLRSTYGKSSDELASEAEQGHPDTPTGYTT